MATAALLKIDPKTAAVIRNYIAQILQSPLSDVRLKASQIVEAMNQYSVSVSTISTVTGYTTAVINEFLSQAISPQETTSFVWRDGSTQIISLLNFEKVRFQLSNEKAKLNIIYSGNLDDLTLTDNLAAQLVYLGIDDILNFGMIERDTEVDFGENYGLQTQKAIDYVNLKTGKVLQSTDSSDPIFNYAMDGNIKCWSYINGGANGNYTQACVEFSNNLPVFYTHIGRIDRGRGTTGVFTNIFNMIKPFAPMIAMAAGFTGLAAIVGDAVVGSSIAAQYPILSTAVGQTAVNTALTGGNVALAATMAAKGAIAQGVVPNTYDPTSVGYIAASAAQAAVVGGNVKSAVSKALLFSGAAQLDTTDVTAVDQSYDESTNTVTTYYSDGTSDTSSPTQGVTTITAADLGIDPSQATNIVDNADNFAASGAFVGSGALQDELYPDATGNIFTAAGSFVTLNQDAFVKGCYMDNAGNVYSPSNQVLMTHDEVQTLIESNPNNPSGAVSDHLMGLWQNTQGVTVPSGDSPPSRPADIPPPAKETKVPTILDQLKATDSISKLALSIVGTTKQIITGKYQPNYATSQYGMPRVQAVGVPVRQPDGTTITNNGNGTQTVRSPTGAVSTVSTGFTGSQGSILSGVGLNVSTNTLLIGGGVLLAVLLLRK